MLKLDFTADEYQEIYNKIAFTDMQKRIIKYRDLEYSVVKMANLEHCSTSKIDKEIDKIKKKIIKVI